jgi:NADPH:quinone reductase-like Zn-dependent oxidoreductase
MKAAYVEGFCDASGIRYGDLPEPAPGPGQVLVHVEAVAVNKVDTLVRSGAWPTPVAFPLAVGRDLAGTVVAVGPDADDVRSGDRVWANSAGYGGRPGATAELVVVERERLYRLPSGAGPAAFVAAIHPGATAYGALIGQARIQPGEIVAVIGGNGAVGMCLIQVAAACGAHPLAVVRDRRAAPRLRGLGARHVAVTGNAAGALAAAAAAIAPNGIDVVADTTGRAEFGNAPDLMNPRGRIVVIAGTGRRIDLDQWAFYTRELHLVGFIMSGMTVSELAQAAEWINTQHAFRPLTVSLAPVMRFADAALAHSIVEQGQLSHLSDHTVGRIVLQP